MDIQPDRRADLLDSLQWHVRAHQVLVYQDRLALAAQQSHVPRRRSGRRLKRRVVEAVPARCDDDERVGVDRQLRHRLLRRLRDGQVGHREAVRVGELLPVVRHEYAKAQRLRHWRNSP